MRLTLAGGSPAPTPRCWRSRGGPRSSAPTPDDHRRRLRVARPRNGPGARPAGAGLRTDIAIGGLDPRGGAAGAAVWILFALAGGTRMLRDPGGHGTLSLHLPFIAAAMILGGPVAGALGGRPGHRGPARAARGAVVRRARQPRVARPGGARRGPRVRGRCLAAAGGIGPEDRWCSWSAASPARGHSPSSPRSSRRASSSCATAWLRRTHSPSWIARSGGPRSPRRCWAGCSWSSGSPSAGGRPPCAPWSCSPCGARRPMRRLWTTTS